MRKKKLSLISSVFLVGLFCILGMTVLAQTSPADCKLGCTSNDVQIKSAYLSDINGNKLSSSFVCPQSGTATVYLTLELTTKTPRVGVVIYANIKNFTGGVVGSTIATPSQCFGIALNQPTNKVTFQNSFVWSCGVPIVMTDVFLGWGTGNTNFCTGTGFQCPATSSKCYSLPPGQYIAIETPVPQNQTVTQCSDQPGGTTSTFNLNNVTVTTSSNVTITWWENYTSPSTFSNQISTPGSYSSGSKIVYAKITSNADNTVFTVANVTLIVNQTPSLTITNPAALCSPATADITAAVVTAGSTLPSGTTLTYYLDNNNAPGSQITSTAAQTLGDGKYWIKATTNTNPACSDTKSVVVTVKPTPAAPILSKVDNCDGTTTITAKDASNNIIAASELTWSNGANTNPISVSTTTAITATRTVNGCTSGNSNSITPAPRTTPGAPVLSKIDNCDGTTTITAKDASNNIISASELTWSNGATTNPISVSTTTAVTATRTVNGCTSGNSNSIAPAPKTTPGAPILSKVDNCDGTTTITAKDASNNIISAGELTWSNGATTNPINVTTTTTVTATRTVNGCTSSTSNSISPAPKTTPAAPVLSKVDNCDGTTTITAKDASNNIIAASELTWSNGANTNPISVSTTTAITATRTVNGCTSGNSNTITPAPKTTPGAPVLSKVDNCDGTTTITAKDGTNNVIPASQLTWSNGATTNPISVTTTTAVTATRTVNGCTSGNSNSITPSPKTTPGKPAFRIIQPSLCGPSTGTLTICQSVSGFDYTVGATTKSGNGASLDFTGLAAGSNPSLTVAYPGGVCPSTSFSCGDAVDCPSGITKATATSEFSSSEATVKAYPNPFSDKIKFVVTSPIGGKGNLEVYNMMGQRVKTVYQGYISSGTQTFELSLPTQQIGNLVYVLRIGDKRISGKILQINQ